MKRIRRSLHRWRYFVGDAWDEWRHSRGVNLMALATLATVLFLAGLVVLIVFNLERRMDRLRDDVRVEVFLRDGQDADQVRALVAELSAIDGVEHVEHVDKEQALERYRAWAAGLARLVNELDANPLPASLDVRLAPGGGAAGAADAIASRLRGREAVEEVRFSQERLERLESVLEFARACGIGLALLVTAAVVLVMASVLRLAVYARREEIEIMQLVGATPGFIRGPYLVAGAVQGLAAALLALALVEAVRAASTAWAGARSVALLELAAARPLSGPLCLALVGVGVLVGVASAYFAVRRPA
jgi:cell division transport system permease protein